jgi:hypothetical protein
MLLLFVLWGLNILLWNWDSNWPFASLSDDAAVNTEYL